MNTMYMLHGIMGSGKSTWAKKFVLEHPDTKIVSGDGFRLMLNGEYKYLVELDDIITASMVDTIKRVLAGGYNVIVDVGNITAERRSSWMEIPVDKRIAVVMPRGDRQWHVGNRETSTHWDKTPSGFIYDREAAALEPLNEHNFDEIIEVDKW